MKPAPLNYPRKLQLTDFDSAFPNRFGAFGQADIEVFFPGPGMLDPLSGDTNRISHFQKFGGRISDHVAHDHLAEPGAHIIYVDAHFLKLGTLP